MLQCITIFLHLEQNANEVLYWKHWQQGSFLSLGWSWGLQSIFKVSLFSKLMVWLSQPELKSEVNPSTRETRKRLVGIQLPMKSELSVILKANSLFLCFISCVPGSQTGSKWNQIAKQLQRKIIYIYIYFLKQGHRKHFDYLLFNEDLGELLFIVIAVKKYLSQIIVIFL